MYSNAQFLFIRMSTNPVLGIVVMIYYFLFYRKPRHIKKKLTLRKLIESVRISNEHT